MNFSQVAMNFKGQLSGQTYIARNPETRKPVEKERTYDEMIRSYDKQIEKIQNQKAKAIELDTFMRTDKTVQALIEKLPATDVIEIDNLFDANCEGDNNPELKMANLSLLHAKDGGNEGLETHDVQDTKGEIDKKGIIEWLKSLVENA